MPEFDDGIEDEDMPVDPFSEGEVDDILKPETDPTTIAFLDQSEAEFAAERERFKEFYGFDHNCTCSKDYTDGKIGMVTECFMGLTSDALARCAEATQENRVLGGMVEHLLRINNDLVRMMHEGGMDKELEEYFTESDAVDVVEAEDLDAVPETEAENAPADEQLSFDDEEPEA
jgi:hypothetical protein